MHGTLFLATLLLGSALPEPQKATDELEAEIQSRSSIVELWAADPILIRAVREANDAPRSMKEIGVIDARWQETVGVDDFIRSVLEHPASERLRELRSSNPELQEAFLTDRLGANVASTNKTSDFYQGDEAKFKNAYNDGAGAIYIGEIERDESIQSFSAQISAPIMDGDEAIGVLVVTVNAEKLRLMLDSR